MPISKLKIELDEKLDQQKILSKQINNIRLEINSLRDRINILELEEFTNFLEIGEEIEFSGYYNFNKSYTKESDAKSNFTTGDKIKIVKKNQKSIGVEVIKKIMIRWDSDKNSAIKDGYKNPGWKLRIELESFYSFYLSNSDRKLAFETYLKRKESIDSLFTE